MMTSTDEQGARSRIARFPLVCTASVCPTVDDTPAVAQQNDKKFLRSLFLYRQERASLRQNNSHSQLTAICLKPWRQEA
jgi:hypothetical protein